MEPSADYSPPSASAPPYPGPTPDYKDRSTGLIVFGIIEILGGFLCALGIPFMLLSLALGRRAGGAMPVGNIVMIVVTYAALAAILITLGIGSTMAKRWARALNLILSWIWVIFGIMVTVIIIAVMPSAFLTAMRTAAQRDPNAGSAPPGLMAVILTFMIVMMAIFLVVVPLVFLLFYRSRNVAETVRHRDPVERWTDRVPLPVLAFSLMAACGAAYYLLVGVTTPLFPFFGRYLTGNPGRLAFVLFAALDVYIAISFFRLKVSGWWVAVISAVFRVVSAVITFRRADLMEAYVRMGWSHKQLEAMQNNPVMRSGSIMWWSLLAMVAHVGFLVWLKRYFHAAPPPQGITTPETSTPFPS